MSEIRKFRCDYGKENYSQLNNKVNPKNTCNTTSMVMALDYCGYKFPENNDMFPEFPQPEDKLTLFCLTNPEVLEYYEKLSPTMYNQWIAEFKKLKEANPDKDIKDFVFKDSYPPNEVHAVLSFATNKFIGVENATNFRTDLSVEDITRELVDQKPVVVSVKFGKLNHVLTIVGVNLEKQPEGWTPISFIVDDTYGKFDFKEQKYDTSVSGNDTEIPAENLILSMKAIGSPKKWGHLFTPAPAVV